MNSKASWTRAWLALVVGTVGLALTLSASAQVETTTTTTAHKASVQTTVESGVVVYVSGNDLLVKASDGSIRHFANVPESARVTVDGQQLGIHDLKPGMKLQRTITTTTTPKTITVVKSVTGTVWYISPPSTVILKLWFFPSARVRITELGGFTNHTLPVTLCTVLMVLGVVVVVMVR